MAWTSILSSLLEQNKMYSLLLFGLDLSDSAESESRKIWFEFEGKI